MLDQHASRSANQAHCGALWNLEMNEISNLSRFRVDPLNGTGWRLPRFKVHEGFKRLESFRLFLSCPTWHAVCCW